MLQILQAIDSNPADKTKATLIFGNVTEADILLRKEFEGQSSPSPLSSPLASFPPRPSLSHNVRVTDMTLRKR